MPLVTLWLVTPPHPLSSEHPRSNVPPLFTVMLPYTVSVPNFPPSRSPVDAIVSPLCTTTEPELGRAHMPVINSELYVPGGIVPPSHWDCVDVVVVVALPVLAPAKASVSAITATAPIRSRIAILPHRGPAAAMYIRLGARGAGNIWLLV